MNEIPMYKTTKEVPTKKVTVFKEKKNLNELWTQKYNPMNAKSIIGNQTMVVNLREWLEKWYENLGFVK